MAEVILLGGYGRAGQVCLRKLVESTRATIVVAGRSIQRAERIAVTYEARSRAVYGNATDPRTLENLLPGAAAAVSCCPVAPLAALEVAIRARVPFVSLTPMSLDESTLRTLADQAWRTQTPVVLQAGALPGLPGVLADYLVRSFPSVHTIRIAASEVAEETQRAENGSNESARNGENRSRRSWPLLRWHFPEPVGTCLVRPTQSLDLEGFLTAHCVQELQYLEPDQGWIARGLQGILRRKASPGFALVGEAYLESDSPEPAQRIELQAPGLLTATAAAISTLVQALIAGKVPAGLLTPREALNPAVFLDGLQKRGVQVRISQPNG